MKKPTLVIMAAGMGSRYGGLKQIDPIDPQGHIIMDYSIYDAVQAGFGKVVFIIKKENEADFKEAVGKRIEKIMDVAYVNSMRRKSSLESQSVQRSRSVTVESLSQKMAERHGQQLTEILLYL